jgi:PleD family two-component response regulator
VLKSIAGLEIPDSKNDFFGRFGGDEFMILMNVAEGDILIERLESIRDKIKATTLSLRQGPSPLLRPLAANLCRELRQRNKP